MLSVDKKIIESNSSPLDVVVVSNNYPNNREPNRGAFVYNLVQELVKQENDISVIAPIKLHQYFSYLRNRRDGRSNYGTEHCEVYRPVYISLGNRKILGIDLGKITFWFMQLSVRRCFRYKIKKCDLLYAHFLINAMTVLEIATKERIPLIVASGESKYRDLALWSEDKIKRLVNQISYYIAVSQYNKEELLKIGVLEDRISIVPNAVDYDRFCPKDKKISREKLNLYNKKFIVGFIGHFIDRKGPNRLIKAVENLNDPEIMVVCVGKGEIEKKDFVTVIEPMANDKLPDLINCFDIFVLPTLAEGHCNIIEEVMACGVPVISSLGTSVEKQIDSETGILINPIDIDQIGEAIKILKADFAYRNRLHENLLKKRGEWSLQERAKKINKIYKEVVK